MSILRGFVITKQVVSQKDFLTYEGRKAIGQQPVAQMEYLR